MTDKPSQTTLPDTVRDTAAMIAGMDPLLDPEIYHFCTGPEPLLVHALASFREAEGLSLVLTDDVARAHDLLSDLPMRRITLRVHSALDGVGLTAAVAGMLARAGIACNMVAGLRHDHAFVPAADAVRALDILEGLARESSSQDASGGAG